MSMMLWSAVLLPLLAALVLAFVPAKKSSALGWGLALIPAAIFVAYAMQAPLLWSGQVPEWSMSWFPALNFDFAFRLDGLALLFVLLVSGVGTLIFIYGGSYLSGDPKLKRFFVVLLTFLTAMLGIVSSDDLITLFLFWELTSISSYLLIGFKHESEEARASALRALLVTAMGGLCLLAGILLLGESAGTYRISELMAKADEIRNSDYYGAIFTLFFLGAATKSAQLPFHFWLPGAMVAPTPVSAYLHSATMVKAGVFLLARMHPILSGTSEWSLTLKIFGGATFVIAGAVALGQKDLKKLLAYTTVSALGALFFLLSSSEAVVVKAALYFLLTHALYKGALFMVAGTLDHQSGTRDIDRLYGLKRAMPMTCFAAVLAALSMAGFPPFIGFISKEAIYEGALHYGGGFELLVSFVGNVFNGAVALLVGIGPFFKRSSRKALPSSQVREGALGLWLGPVVLGVLGLLLGVLGSWLGGYVFNSPVTAVLQRADEVHLSLWHGFTWILALSLLTLLAAVLIYLKIDKLLLLKPGLQALVRWTPQRVFDSGLKAVLRVAEKVRYYSQDLPLREYALISVLFAVIFLAWGLLHISFPVNFDFGEVAVIDLALSLVITVAALAAVITNSRLAAIAEIGVVGLAVTFFFVIYGAPDLAMTQILVEILSVILFVLVVFRLPTIGALSKLRTRVRDGIVSISLGLTLALATFLAVQIQVGPSISAYFKNNSYLNAFGKNVVNVILVDFRGFDTLGEITVLGIAALGVFSLLMLNQREKAASNKKKGSTK